VVLAAAAADVVLRINKPWGGALDRGEVGRLELHHGRYLLVGIGRTKANTRVFVVAIGNNNIFVENEIQPARWCLVVASQEVGVVGW
jgi:hypothetical protein